MFIIVSWILVGIAAGGLLGGAFGDAASNHPGDIGRIFGGLVVGAMIGGVCGGVLGKALQARFAGNQRNLKIAGAVPWIGAAVLVVGIIMFETVREERARQTRLPDSLIIKYEVWLPSGTQANPEHVILELQTSTGNLPPYPYQQKPVVVQEDGRTVIRSGFEIFRAAADRTVAVQLAHGQPTYLFKLRLPERPAPGDVLTGWQPVDRVDDGGWFKGPRPARPDERLEIRYAVARPF